MLPLSVELNSWSVALHDINMNLLPEYTYLPDAATLTT